VQLKEEKNMCGITGWIDTEVDLLQNKEILNSMATTLTPRGPDAYGIWLSARAGLAHRRLVVVDPAGGAQPMLRQRGDEKYVLTYNGELYNTEEIRKELRSKGYTFQGHSDTEVLLMAYIEWGKACLSKLNGIFAFAVWEEKRETLFMARDRMGVKPLFYTQQGSAFLYASELKALLSHPIVKPEIDSEGLAEIFIMGPARTPGHGIFRGIKELRPGYCLTYSRNKLQVERYWSLESFPHCDDLETTTEKIRELFIDTVERQLVADVPVCTLLSGGLDSSAITAVAANYYQRLGFGPLHTFSVDYTDNERYFKPSAFQPNADSPFIDLVTKQCGTVHHSITVDTPQLVDALLPAMRAKDLPGMVDVDSSLLLFCREIKKHSTVALSGECADEIFGGYPWFHSEEALSSNTFPWARMTAERGALLNPELARVIRPEEYMAYRYEQTVAEVPLLPEENTRDAKIRRLFYLNLTWFMNTLLDRKDRMSMATGLEVRVPFADHRIIEYLWNVPWEQKFSDQREKGILRRALKGLLPEKILTRRKSPYPKTHNPAYTAAVKEWLLTILNDSSSPLLPLIDRQAVLNIVETQSANTSFPWFGQLMSGPQLFAYLAQVDSWLREYKVSIK
jgi:asparagine synthase (glutamine-hydrolysing)